MTNLIKNLMVIGKTLGENHIKSEVAKKIKEVKTSKVIDIDGYKLQIIKSKMYVVEVKKVFKNKIVNELNLNQLTAKQLIKLHQVL